MRKSWRARAAIAAAAFVVCTSHARAGQESDWIGGEGNWTDGFNWSTSPRYPNNGTISYDAVIANGGVANVDHPISVDNFTLVNGVLGGNSELNVSGLTHWRDGYIIGNGQLNVQQRLLIDSQTHGLSGFTLTIFPNAGVDWTGWSIFEVGNGGGGIDNSGAIFDSTDGSWLWGGVAPVLNNFGGYYKVAGTLGENKSIQAVFNNFGYTEVDAGDLWLAGGGSNTGSFSVSSGGRLMFSDMNVVNGTLGHPITTFSPTAVVSSTGVVEFDHPTFQSVGFVSSSTTEFSGSYDATFTRFDMGGDGQVHFMPGSTYGVNLGAGDIEAASGAVVFDTGTPFPIQFNSVTLDGGTIRGSDEFSFLNLLWSGGIIGGDDLNSGTQVSYVGSGAVISGPGVKALVSRELVLFQGINTTISGGGTIQLANGTLANFGNILTVATMDFQTDVNITNLVPTVPSYFFNFGMLKKSGGSGSVVFDAIRFVNTSTMSIQSGKLRIAGDDQETGTILISSGAALELGSSPQLSEPAVHTLAASSKTTGPAGSRLTLNNAIVNASGLVNVGNIDINNATVTLGGGTFISTGNLQLTGAASVTVAAGSNTTFKAGGITTDTAGGSKLDLTDNTLVITYASSLISPADSIRQQIQSAFNNGAWNGNGITSSLADSLYGLGYADDSSNVVIHLALFGDANLDGLVNGTDLDALAAHWQANALWSGGDFDYSGIVDNNDELTLLPNWAGGINSLNAALAARGLPPVVVPEPAALLLPLISCGLLRRRRSRS